MGLLFSLTVHNELERLESQFNWTPEPSQLRLEQKGLWIAPATATSESVYSDSEWQQMDELLDQSWWFNTRRYVVLRLLTNVSKETTIWDLGCGNGQMAKSLIERGYSVIGLEPSRTGARLSADRGVPTFCAEFPNLKLPDHSLRAVSMFDVLEHLPDRDALLREVFRTLQPGGLLILTLPALQWLWSQFDVDGGHFIRYSRKTIKTELHRAGFEVSRIGYFFALTVLPIFIFRSLPFRIGKSRTSEVSATVGGPGWIFGPLLTRFERWLAMRVPFGSSISVIAMKPESRKKT